MFLAIDPGLSTGWAVLDARGNLTTCGAGENFPTLSNREAVIERPQVYRPGKSKGNPNDLITLAIRVGRYQERLLSAGVRCPDANLVLPTSWKGQIDKLRHHLRTDATLSEHERAIVYRVAKAAGDRGYHEDVWDSVALAKWGFGAGPFAKLSL